MGAGKRSTFWSSCFKFTRGISGDLMLTTLSIAAFCAWNLRCCACAWCRASICACCACTCFCWADSFSCGGCCCCSGCCSGCSFWWLWWRCCGVGALEAAVCCSCELIWCCWGEERRPGATTFVLWTPPPPPPLPFSLIEGVCCVARALASSLNFPSKTVLSSAGGGGAFWGWLIEIDTSISLHIEPASRLICDVCLCRACMCVCVCVRESEIKSERERASGRERPRKREHVHARKPERKRQIVCNLNTYVMRQFQKRWALCSREVWRRQLHCTKE